MLKKAPYEIPKNKRIRVIIDTDCCCEADDQYAVAHQLMTPKLDVVGITPSHFNTQMGKFPDAATTAKMSYDEVNKVLDLMSLTDEIKVYQGCDRTLPDEKVPVDSAASRFIVEEAMKDDERPLFITVQGAITNVASAYLMKPEIASRMTVIWIGGGEYPVGGMEFNVMNDINAANVIMDSPIELWQVPQTVYKTMRVSFATLYEKVYPYGKIGEYLYEHMVNEINPMMIEMLSNPAIEARFAAQGISRGAQRCMNLGGESWSLGDSPVVGLLLTDHDGQYTVEGAPRFNTNDCTYLLRPDNPRKIRVYNKVDSHFILDDFFAKLKYYFG